MKRILIFLWIIVSNVLFINAEHYTLKSPNHIFYRNDANSKETRVFPGGIIPSENVYVRMHVEDREGSTFEIETENHVVYVCKAPNQWPGQQLKDCIVGKKNKNEVRGQASIANAIAMGNTVMKRESQFHYLFAFVSQFDDPHWTSFPYADKDVEQMQQAIDVVRSNQQYLRGKQYLLSMPRITKKDITSRMDSILQNTEEGDFVFLYFSSHGEKDEQNLFHFITKDTYRDKKGEFVNSLTKSEINTFVNKLTSKKARVLFFLDACYAGSVLDNSIQGEAAYYVSTNSENAAYYNRLFGSPFAISLMETMTGCINNKYAGIFKDNQVQVGSLGNYLSSNVYDQSEQRPLSDEHAFRPSYVLWNIHPQAPKAPLVIQQLAKKAETDPEKMIELGDRYYNGDGTSVDFYKAFECYDKATTNSKKKETKSKGLLRMSYCFYYGNPEQDSVMAFEYALEAAKLNNLEAMTEVGLHLCNGMGTKENPKEGIGWIKRAAQKNFSDAQYYLAYCYEYGVGVEQSDVKASAWYAKAAQQGDVEAQTKLGYFFLTGQGVSKDTTAAVKWYTKAAEQNYPLAQYNLGVCYDEGSGVIQSYEKAFEWYTKAAEQGYVYAQYNLGVFYDIGKWVSPSVEKAIEWYSKAAEQGDFNAQYNLGIYYYNGEGCTKSYEKAFEWFYKAAQQGDDEAQNMVGYLYDTGRGIKQSNENAFEWYSKSAEQGNEDSQYNLGLLYYNGKGVVKDKKKAHEWFTKAAEQGNANAQSWLGYLYIKGEGVSQDYAKAVEWYSKAAEQGDADAQNSLGNRYYYGEGVSQDYAKAVKWYTKAAGQGKANAQYKLGVCYDAGKGVPQNYTKAVEWYTKAAEQGHVNAQYNLGICYYNGEGVPQDKKKAYEWFSKAAIQNDQESIDIIRKYYGK